MKVKKWTCQSIHISNNYCITTKSVVQTEFISGLSAGVVPVNQVYSKKSQAEWNETVCHTRLIQEASQNQT